ncbi:MFS transporter [Chloroflexota bacterium]
MMQINRKPAKIFYGWWIVALGAIIIATGHGILMQSFTVFFLPFKREFLVSSTSISLLYGAIRLEGGFEGPVVGYLIDRFGSKKMVIAGAIMAATGLIILSTVHNFTVFFLVYVLLISVGFNTGFWHPIFASVNMWFVRRRGTCFSIINAAAGVGGMVMAPLLSYLILNYSWRTAALFAGFVVALVVIPAALPMKRSPEALGLYPDGRLATVNQADKQRGDKGSGGEADFKVKQALKTSTYWLLALGMALRVSVTVALSAHLVPILVWRGMDEASAAYMVSLYAFGIVVTSLTLGWLSDRWNKARLFSLGIAVSIIGVLGLLLVQNDVILYIFTIALSITMGVVPIGWALVGDFFGRYSYATLRGIISVGVGIGTFVSPIYAGWLFDRTGSYNIALITYSVVLLIAVAIFALLRPPQMRGDIISQYVETPH